MRDVKWPLGTSWDVLRIISGKLPLVVGGLALQPLAEGLFGASAVTIQRRGTSEGLLHAELPVSLLYASCKCCAGHLNL